MRTRAEAVAFWLTLLVGAVASLLCLITTLTTGIGWDSGIDTQAAIEVGRLDGAWDLRTAYECGVASEFEPAIASKSDPSFAYRTKPTTRS